MFSIVLIRDCFLLPWKYVDITVVYGISCSWSIFHSFNLVLAIENRKKNCFRIDSIERILAVMDIDVVPIDFTGFPSVVCYSLFIIILLLFQFFNFYVGFHLIYIFVVTL